MSPVYPTMTKKQNIAATRLRLFQISKKQDQQTRADADAVHYQEPISICPAADILCIFVHFQALIH